MDVNRAEIYRYLGYKGQIPDEHTRSIVEECITELEGCISPRTFYRNFPMRILEDGTIDIGCMTIKSRNLLKNVQGCEELILFAATLGTGPDYLVERNKRFRMSKAVVLQAAAAAMIEAYCNEKNTELRELYRAKGMFLRPRFSPGYGDFPLEVQKQLTAILSAEKTVGITLTESLLMLPTKSVTAVIGAGRRTEEVMAGQGGDENEECELSGCEVCGKTNCLYRRN